jgi:hypothetical protein
MDQTRAEWTPMVRFGSGALTLLVLVALAAAPAAAQDVGGMFLSDRASVRLEQGWSGEHEGIAVSSISLGLTTTRIEQRFRMRTTAVMAGYDLPSDSGIRLALLAGVVIARERTHLKTELDYTLPPGLLVPPGFELPLIEGSTIDRTATFYKTGVALGADADWHVHPPRVGGAGPASRRSPIG